jgi:glutathione S-transferase
VRYENVEALNKKLGTGPTHDSPPFYTLPLILDERPGAEPKAVVDSVKIAEYIEGLYPDRPLVTAALIAELKPHYDAILTNVALPMFPIVVPAAVNNFDGPTAEFYARTRPEIFGETLY